METEQQAHQPDRRKTERRQLLERAMRGDRLVIVRVEKVYGREMIYPVSPAAAAIAQIAGTKTLRREDLALARDVLGFEIVEDPRARLDLPRSSTVKP